MTIGTARGCNVEMDRENETKGMGATFETTVVKGKVKELRLGVMTGPGLKTPKDIVIQDLTVWVDKSNSGHFIWLGPRFLDEPDQPVLLIVSRAAFGRRPVHRRRRLRRHLRHHRRGHARRLVHGRPPLHRTGRQHPRLGHAQPRAAQLPRRQLQRRFHPAAAADRTRAPSPR